MPPVMTLRTVVAAFLLSVAAAAPSAATDDGRAERLYSKGLAEFHAGRNDEALALFQQAVEADPNDARSLYYRALGFGRVGRYDEAVADLRRVVAAADPVLERDRLELGYALYRSRNLDAAVVELEGASKRQSVAAEASLLLGIVESRRGNHEAAVVALARAEQLDPSRAVPARYYQGLAAWRSDDVDKAREHFTWVSTRSADSPYGREAAAFLEQLDEGGARRYRLNAGIALEYDSNVALAPDDDTVANFYGISGEDDGRAVLTAGGRYALLSHDGFNVVAGYQFLQSLHFTLDEFNIQTHSPGVEASYATGPFTFGVGSSYEFSLLDDASLMHGVNLLPWARYDEGELGRAEVYYRMRWRDFLPDDFDPERDSTNHAVGARQFFALGERDRNVILGYRFDADVADDSLGDQFAYDGHQFEFGFEWTFDANTAADLVYAYRFEDYDTDASLGRDDDEHTVIARLERRLHEYVWLVGAYIFRRNLSDQQSYEYVRHVTSLGVEARY